MSNISNDRCQLIKGQTQDCKVLLCNIFFNTVLGMLLLKPRGCSGKYDTEYSNKIDFQNVTFPNGNMKPGERY